MWCYFYEPQRLVDFIQRLNIALALSSFRLPRSYVRWISKLANLDERLVEALQLIRTKDWSYASGSKHHSGLLEQYAMDLGRPASWGNPAALPAYGGATANKAWKQLGLTTRPGVGGIPCELAHGTVGSSMGLSSSCHANAALRFTKAFAQALAIYLPVCFRDHTLHSKISRSNERIS